MVKSKTYLASSRQSIESLRALPPIGSRPIDKRKQQQRKESERAEALHELWFSPTDHQKGSKTKNVSGSLQRFRILSKSMVEHNWQFPLLDYLFLSEIDDSFTISNSGIKLGIYAKLAISLLIELAIPPLQPSAVKSFKKLKPDERRNLDSLLQTCLTKVWNSYHRGETPFTPLQLSLTKIRDISRAAGVGAVSGLINSEPKFQERNHVSGKVQKRYKDREKQKAVLDAVWQAICDEPSLIFSEK